MGGDLTQALRTAHSGLLAGQQALDVVARNIANVNTPGYSRKIVNLEQRTLAGHGAGVQFGQLSRHVDQELLAILRREEGVNRAKEVYKDGLDSLQHLFGTPESNTSLSHTLTQMQGAIEAMAVTPQDGLEQQAMVRWAGEVASMLRRSSREVQSLRQQADERIGTAVQEINGLLQTISDLNAQVVRSTSFGYGAVDLLDQRDQALDRLSQLIDVDVSGRSSGEVVVFTSGGRTLVDSTGVTLSHIAAVDSGATVTYVEGDFDGIYAGTRIPGNDITADIRTGELRGLLDLRDGTLPALQSSLDELASRLRDTVNAVHNRGVAYPGTQQFRGTQTFGDPATQTIRFGGTSDTALVLFDGLGNEVARTTVRTLLGAVAPADSTTSINGLAAAIGGWAPGGTLGTPLAADVTDGKLNIRVNDARYTLAMRDQTATAAGSAAQDASILFDADGTAGPTPPRTATGFSGFFGLNDFFVDATVPAVHDSSVLGAGFSYLGANATLTLRNAGVGTATVNIAAGATLADVVASLRAVSGVEAALIPDGTGVRLRVSSSDGKPLTITETPDPPDLVTHANNLERFLAQTGLRQSEAGSSSSIAVRADIAATPRLVARGVVQWDASLPPAGKYAITPGDATVAAELARSIGADGGFAVAGRMSATNATFVEYASSFIGDVSGLATENRADVQYQKDLVDSLRQKSEFVRGVNLDEEVSDLLVYEQAYAAAARIVQVVQQMFDALERAVG